MYQSNEVVTKMYRDIQRMHKMSSKECKAGIPEGASKKLERDLRMLFMSHRPVSARDVHQIYKKEGGYGT